MSRTYRRTQFNKKTKAKRMYRYWQYNSEAEVQDFYEKCLAKKENGENFYEPSHPYRYHSDNYYSKNNKRKRVFLKVYKKKLRQDSGLQIRKFMCGLQDDVTFFETIRNILRVID